MYWRWAGAALFSLCVSQAVAEPVFFGAFSIDPDYPEIIALTGEIDASSPLDFHKALRAAPHARIVGLSSNGGGVYPALVIADDIHQRGLGTVILPEHTCASACAFLFFAGQPRVDQGLLGVHQFSLAGENVGNLGTTQLTLSDIIDALTSYGVPPQVISIMLRTAPEDMHFFTREEITALALNTGPASAALSTGDTPPLATASRDTQESQSIRIVTNLIDMHNRQTGQIEGALIDAYEPTIEYYGKGSTLAEVMADKQRYFQRWPQRTSTVRPGSIWSSCNGRYCDVGGIYDWKVASAPRGKSAAGVASFRYRLDIQDGWKVVSESGKVVR